MIFDWDDHGAANDAMPWMWRLKEINPAFKATLFAVPGRGSAEFWDSHPGWIELAVHGYMHPDSYECQDWNRQRMKAAIRHKPAAFVTGFKAPGWQISAACYDVLLERGWWVADQHLEDDRRPPDLPVYLYEDGEDRWHGHVQDVCGNGLQETWKEVVALVAGATEFRFCSEALGLCVDRLHTRA